MSNDLYTSTYNPDVLSCIANLSNDEVFTPPEVANSMLDMLPQELFQSPDTTFLDPACKSGVFLREIAKRLLVGLEEKIPDRQERIDHIFKKQLYGIAITELTSLLSRRSLYCSKYPNSIYSVARFDDVQGNVRFKNTQHRWKDGKCVFCGASEKEYGKEKRGDDLETHAYELIHTTHPEEIFNMKFDVIIGNPPYQLNTQQDSKQAKPIYNLFVEQAKKLNPRYLSMIIPSRWFSGGMGLDGFRNSMMTDSHLSHIIDYVNAKECFPENSISGGVCYFLWERDKKGACEFSTVQNGHFDTMTRELNKFSVIIRYNVAEKIIQNMQQHNEKSIADIVSSINPFGFGTSSRGEESIIENGYQLLSSKGFGYIRDEDLKQNIELANRYKVIIGQVISEHAVEPNKDGTYKLLSSLKVLYPRQICTFSYLTIGSFDDEELAENLKSYLSTKFVRFLLLQSISSIHITKDKFCFVPIQDFSKSWTDEELYAKYGLTYDEISFIESMIRPMD